MSSEMNQAEKIAHQFDNDGRTWAKDGVDITSVCESEAVEKDQNWARETTRYVFNDNSVIVFGTDGWDFGIAGSDCSCMLESGHDDDDCEE